jgi:peptide/nickel transport system substrate-binding protein
MHLRKGVKFHDGSDFTAKDVDFTYKLMVRRESAPAVIDVTIFEGANEYLMKKTETFAGLDVIDDYTVRFNLTAPSSTFLINVSNTGILPAHAFPSDALAKNFNDESIEKMPFFQTKPIGTGPFMLKDFDYNTHTSLTAFDQYWKGAPLLDGIDMLYNYTDSSVVSALLSGQIDSSYVDEQTARTLMHASNLHLNIGQGLANETDLFVACEKPYMNVPVRQALRTAIDLPTLIKTVLYGLARPAPSMMMYPALFPNPRLPQYNYDPARAKQLLKQGNWDPSRTLVFGVETALTSPDNATLAIMNMWQDVGIQTAFKPIDPANAQNILLAKEHSYDVVILQYAWLAYNPSTTFAEFSSSAASTNSNYTNYRSAAYDSIMSKAIRTADTQEANSLYQQAQVILGTDLPSIPLWMEDEIWAINNALHGGVLHRGPLNDIGAQLWWKG